MSTTDITLTHQEKKELEKRGFLVKESLSIKGFMYFYLGRSSFLLFVITILVLIVPYISIILIASFVLGYFSIFRMIGAYILLGKLFYSGDQVFEGPRFFDRVTHFFIKEEVLLAKTHAEINNKILNYKGPLQERIKRQGPFNTTFDYIYSIFFPIFIVLVFMKVTYIPLIVLGILYIGVPIASYFLRQLVEKFNPLYAFGNLGEKIQKLTPQIATQSKEIQENFVSDMDFRVLSDGFDGLASTFSQIVSLVIRLEKTEQKANKGNLFDSEKYISSLRSDIVGPLRSLRSFLDGKRTELAESQQELSRVRVRVGGTSENRDLTSARTEPLMRELTENIDALDMMIGKMG